MQRVPQARTSNPFIRLVHILLKGLEYSESEIVVLLKDDLEEGEDLFHLDMKKGMNCIVLYCID